MSFAVTAPKYRYEDYERWAGDWELIGGYAFDMSPSPHSRHQLIGAAIQFAFMASIRENKTSCNCKVYYETDWIISDETVVRPDIAIVCAEVGPNSHIKVTPALIVEIFPASTRLKDRNTKFKLYESCGVKYYLMADPDLNKLEAFELGENGYREMTGDQFTLTAACNLSPDLSDIFEQ